MGSLRHSAQFSADQQFSYYAHCGQTLRAHCGQNDSTDLASDPERVALWLEPVDENHVGYRVDFDSANIAGSG